MPDKVKGVEQKSSIQLSNGRKKKFRFSEFCAKGWGDATEGMKKSRATLQHTKEIAAAASSRT
ncbi:hypothetical protein KKHLCK_13635 [Candidatus Electrothrix laxa]